MNLYINRGKMVSLVRRIYAACCLFFTVTVCAAGTPHTITVISSSPSAPKWSVYADLYDGQGQRVYHWQETNKKPNTSLTWNFTDGHDGGWVHLWVWLAPSQRFAFLKLPLGDDICYEIDTDPTPWSVHKCPNNSCRAGEPC